MCHCLDRKKECKKTRKRNQQSLPHLAEKTIPSPFVRKLTGCIPRVSLSRTHPRRDDVLVEEGKKEEGTLVATTTLPPRGPRSHQSLTPNQTTTTRAGPDEDDAVTLNRRRQPK